MTTKTKKLATLLPVAVVLSSGAYALGTQTGDGGAVASSGSASASTSANTAAGATNIAATGSATNRGFRGGPGRAGFADLAQKLGVSTTALENALEAIRDEKTPDQRRTEITNALAAALGKPAADVTKALDAVLPDRPDDRRGDFAAALAKALGVDQAKVQAGLDKARQDLGKDRGADNGNRRFDRGAFEDTIVDDIASATGVGAAKVRSALQDLRPEPGRHERQDARDDIRQKLATALGVTTDQLQTAIEKVATDQRDAFATELAQKLNIDAAKVKDALPDFRGGPGPGFGFGFGFGFGGRHHG
jgi:DNA-binding transcriptional MerR regulator